MIDCPDESVKVDVQIACDSDSVPAKPEIVSWIRSAVTEARVSEPVDVSVRIVGEAEARNLNQQYRNSDYATNVLSFPSGHAVWPAEVPRPLGDIVICGPVVQRESDELGKSNADHWAHMLVHGTLHLLGFDHEADAEAATMEALETRILASRGVGDPYAT
jgi:probable rRNA maturation factor